MTDSQASSSFLLIYKQYGTTWKQFIRSLLAILGVLLAYSIVLSIVITIWWVNSGGEVSNSDFLERIIFNNKYVYMTFISSAFTSMIVGIYFAVAKIQKRSFLSLFSIDKSIDPQKIARSYLAWLGSWIAIIVVLAVSQPARYEWIFNWSEWWPAALYSLFFIPILTVSYSFLYSFLLQGFGTLTASPMHYWIITGLSIFVFDILMSFSILSVYSLISSLLYSFLMVYFLLKDNRLEVFSGILAASITYSFLIIGGQNLYFFSSNIFVRRNPSPDILTYISLVPQWILFYLGYFGLKSDPFSVFKTENEETAK